MPNELTERLDRDKNRTTAKDHIREEFGRWRLQNLKDDCEDASGPDADFAFRAGVQFMLVSERDPIFGL